MDQIITKEIMETSTTIQDDQDQIIFTKIMKKDLKIASYWSTFISIFTASIMSLAFFGYTYILYQAYSVSGVPMSEILSGMPWQGYAFLLFFAAILGMLILSSISLLLFSFEVKKAVEHENSEAMDLAVDLLLKFFRYNGMLIIGVFLTAFSIYFYLQSFKI